METEGALIELTLGVSRSLYNNIMRSFCPKDEKEFLDWYNKHSYLADVDFSRDNSYVTDLFAKKYLESVFVLNLGLMSKITDNGLVHLKNIYDLKLGDFSQITNKGLFHLQNVRKLNLGMFSQVTNDGLIYLKDVMDLGLGHYSKVTNDGLKYLKCIRSLDLGGNSKVTFDCVYDSKLNRKCIMGLSHLHNIDVLILGPCNEITNEELCNLSNVNTLIICESPFITNDVLTFFESNNSENGMWYKINKERFRELLVFLEKKTEFAKIDNELIILKRKIKNDGEKLMTDIDQLNERISCLEKTKDIDDRIKRIEEKKTETLFRLNKNIKNMKKCMINLSTMEEQGVPQKYIDDYFKKMELTANTINIRTKNLDALSSVEKQLNHKKRKIDPEKINEDRRIIDERLEHLTDMEKLEERLIFVRDKIRKELEYIVAQ
jgi:hypothetical protein